MNEALALITGCLIVLIVTLIVIVEWAADEDGVLIAKRYRLTKVKP